MQRLFLASFARLYDYDAIKRDFDDSFRGRWIPQENLHLTLYFFGSVKDAGKIIKSTETIVFPRKEVPLMGLGTFSKPPRIFYAGLRTNPFTDSHNALQKKFGASKNHFKPHITLMKVKQTINSQYKEKIIQYDHKIIGVLENEISLVKSEITSKGVIYTKIRT